MANILVSACLLGCECRYKGDGCRNEEICALSKVHTLIPVCPEQLGGLPTPRNPSEIVGERVVMCSGEDVSAHYRKGAETALAIAKLNRVQFAILKAKSPSCGKGIIYDGSFTGAKVAGNGVTAALLLKNGIRVYTEEEIPALLQDLS